MVEERDWLRSGRRMRIARLIAVKAQRRGLWSKADAERFLEALRQRAQNDPAQRAVMQGGDR